MEKLIFYTTCSVLLIFLKTAVCIEPSNGTVALAARQDFNSVVVDSSDGVIQCLNCSVNDGDDHSIEFHRELQKMLAEFYKQDVYTLLGGVTIRRVNSVDDNDDDERESDRSSQDVETQLVNGLERYARMHVVEFNLPQLARTSRALTDKFLPRFGFGKNSFLTGFGLGFLAFGLKKLLLPLFIGAQIVKSVLIAMFLPSIIGAVGKLIGKGLTTAASSSGSSALHGSGNAASDTVTDFDFKDNAGYDSEPANSDGNYGVWTYPPAGSPLLQDTSGRQPFPAYTSSGVGTMAFNNPVSSGTKVNALDRYQQQQKVIFGDQLASMTKHQSSFYTKDKQQDFKVFHNIPTSSQLLANYDPFYSPLLSRLDSVFKQLGYFAENCRERLVCDMYNNPAKFAPFSNLVSAQLSRELNELRKPSSDNPEILRFFRYMKAAKDGQDGAACDRIYPTCMTPGMTNDSPPMITTFNDINKLVQARKLSN